MKSRLRFTPIASTLAVCLLLILSAGCSRAPISGLFVEHSTPQEVSMLRLVESPRGHIGGSLVISSIAQNGSRNKDIVDDVTGTTNGTNISLRINGGGLSRFFGSAVNWVGTLRNNAITLGLGNNTIVFHEMSESSYGKVDTAGYAHWASNSIGEW